MALLVADLKCGSSMNLMPLAANWSSGMVVVTPLTVRCTRNVGCPTIVTPGATLDQSALRVAEVAVSGTNLARSAVYVYVGFGMFGFIGGITPALKLSIVLAPISEKVLKPLGWSISVV